MTTPWHMARVASRRTRDEAIDEKIKRIMQAAELYLMAIDFGVDPQRVDEIIGSKTTDYDFPVMCGIENGQGDMSTHPSLETRAKYINDYTDSYFGRPIFHADGRIASRGLAEYHQKWRAELHDEWEFRLKAAKEWEEMFP